MPKKKKLLKRPWAVRDLLINPNRPPIAAMAVLGGPAGVLRP